MNLRYWTHPPSSYQELELWKVFVACNRDQVYQKVIGWYKKLGHPIDDEHSFYKLAIRIAYHNQ